MLLLFDCYFLENWLLLNRVLIPIGVFRMKKNLMLLAALSLAGNASAEVTAEVTEQSEGVFSRLRASGLSAKNAVVSTTVAFRDRVKASWKSLSNRLKMSRNAKIATASAVTTAVAAATVTVLHKKGMLNEESFNTLLNRLKGFPKYSLNKVKLVSQSAKQLPGLAKRSVSNVSEFLSSTMKNLRKAPVATSVVSE